MTPPISTSFLNVSTPNIEDGSKENFYAQNFNLDGSLGITGILSSPLCSSARDNKIEQATNSSAKDKSKCDNSILNMTILFPELSCTAPSNAFGIDSDEKSSASNEEVETDNDLVSADETEETMEQRIAREQRESEELARQLMAEEAVASYSMSINYLRDNTDAFSPEDLEALNFALFSEEEHAAAEELEEESNEELSYDAMIRLGETLGDVKEERWRMKSKGEIAKLPTITYDEKLGENKEDDSLQRCLVCQCCYENGECMRKLPCQHYFHKDCVDQWLHSKDFCPYCRQSIV